MHILSLFFIRTLEQFVKHEEAMTYNMYVSWAYSGCHTCSSVVVQYVFLHNSCKVSEKQLRVLRCRYITTVFPIGAMFAMTLWLGNSAYLYISVSFAQMLKAISMYFFFMVKHSSNLRLLTQGWLRRLLNLWTRITMPNRWPVGLPLCSARCGSFVGCCSGA